MTLNETLTYFLVFRFSFSLSLSSFPHLVFFAIALVGLAFVDILNDLSLFFSSPFFGNKSLIVDFDILIDLNCAVLIALNWSTIGNNLGAVQMSIVHIIIMRLCSICINLKMPTIMLLATKKVKLFTALCIMYQLMVKYNRITHHIHLMHFFFLFAPINEPPFIDCELHILLAAIAIIIIKQLLFEIIFDFHFRNTINH